MFKLGDRVQILSERAQKKNIYTVVDISDYQDDPEGTLYIQRLNETLPVQPEHIQLYEQPLIPEAQAIQPNTLTQKEWGILWSQMELHMKTDMLFLTSQQLNEYKQYPEALRYHYAYYLDMHGNDLRVVVDVSTFIENGYTQEYVYVILPDSRHKIYTLNELKFIFWQYSILDEKLDSDITLDNILQQFLDKKMLTEYLFVADLYTQDALTAVPAVFSDPNFAIPPAFLDYIRRNEEGLLCLPWSYWNWNFAQAIGKESLILNIRDERIIYETLDYTSYNEIIQRRIISPMTGHNNRFIRDLTKKIPNPLPYTFGINEFCMFLYLYSEYGDIDSMNFVIRTTAKVGWTQISLEQMAENYFDILGYKTRNEALFQNDPKRFRTNSFYVKMINTQQGLLIWRSIEKYIHNYEYIPTVAHIIKTAIFMNYADWIQEMYSLVMSSGNSELRKLYIETLLENRHSWKSFRERNIIVWKDFFPSIKVGKQFAHHKNRLEFLNYISETQPFTIDEQTAMQFFVNLNNMCMFEWVFTKCNNPSTAYACYFYWIKNILINPDRSDYKQTYINNSIVPIFTKISKFIISLDYVPNNESFIILKNILHQNIGELESNKVAVQYFTNTNMKEHEFHRFASNIALLGLTDSILWLMQNTKVNQKLLYTGYYSNSTSMIDLLKKINIENEDTPLHMNNDMEVLFYMDPAFRLDDLRCIVQFDNLSSYKYATLLFKEPDISEDLEINSGIRNIYTPNYMSNGTNIVKYLYTNDSSKHQEILKFLLQALDENSSFAFELFQFMLDNVGR